MLPPAIPFGIHQQSENDWDILDCESFRTAFDADEYTACSKR
jgi:hypothetical protein